MGNYDPGKMSDRRSVVSGAAIMAVAAYGSRHDHLLASEASGL
jgi:hypothetical protein